MHNYSINSPERKQVPFVLAFISIAIVTFAKYKITLPSWIPIPGVFALYGIFYGIFDKWLWKYFSIIKFIKTPDLNGQWKCASKSSVDNYVKQYDGTITIHQTWTSISVFLNGEKFTSKSTMAGIHINTDDNFELKWEYTSQKKPQFSVKDYMHTGMTRVVANEWPKISFLQGDYFTDRSRHNYGSIEICKIKKA